MRLAVVGHSFHRKTKSSAFFTELLRRHAEVDTYWDESWHGGSPLDVAALVKGSYDQVYVWQMTSALRKLVSYKVPGLCFIPMYDNSHHLKPAFWRLCKSVKIINFSRTLHEQLMRRGHNTAWFQYFPDPSDYAVVEDFSSLRCFFWQRRNEISWTQVRKLLSEADVRNVHLHGALDPGCGPIVWPSQAEINALNIKLSSWLEDAKQIRSILAESNVYVAPRETEGIGMGFLEAMAMGMCVAASNRPTHTEYIIDGVNGLLFNCWEPAALQLGKVQEFGKRARETVEVGYEMWARDRDDRLMEFALAPPGTRMRDATEPGFWQMRRLRERQAERGPRYWRDRRGGMRLEADEAPASEGTTSSRPPLVTIAIVVRNAREVITKTIESILLQDHPEIEIVVIDGASTDGTREILDSYANHFAHLVSEPDDGPYDAMNKAAGLATGHWILFMNAGDWFYSPQSVSRAMRHVPHDADFVLGHHVYRTANGHDVLHRVADFAQTSRNIRQGNLTRAWLEGVPGHQATFTRTEFLRSEPYDTGYRYAADHELLYRSAKRGARFHHACEIVSVYTSGGLSFRNQGACIEEWRAIAHKCYEGDDPGSIDSFFDKLQEGVAGVGHDPRGVRRRGVLRRAVSSVGKRVGLVGRMMRPRAAEARGQSEIEQHRDALVRSQLFLESWYVRTYPEVKRSGLAPLEHYFRRGAKQGFNPSPFFDTQHYVSRYPDVRSSGMNPLVHYLVVGGRENREPNPWFNPKRPAPPAQAIAAANDATSSTTSGTSTAALAAAAVPAPVPAPGPAPGPAPAGSEQPAPRIEPPDGPISAELPSWVRKAPEWKFWHSRKRLMRERDCALVALSGLFFESWYLEKYPDVAAKKINPIVHYLRFGAAEGRDPSPFFDTNFYLAHNPDVRQSGMNPLVHYLLYGFRESRMPNAWFDPAIHLPDMDQLSRSDRVPIVEYIARLAHQGKSR